MRTTLRCVLGVVILSMGLARPAAATPFSFSRGNPDGKIATASRPSTPALFEIESADDFVLTDPTQIPHATFTGLLTGTTPSVDQVRVELYRVFPLGDSPEIDARIAEVLRGFVPEPEGFAGQFQRFHDALASGTELPVTLADARAAVELITALYHAARTLQPVSLPLAADHPLYGGWQP